MLIHICICISLYCVFKCSFAKISLLFKVFWPQNFLSFTFFFNAQCILIPIITFHSFLRSILFIWFFLFYLFINSSLVISEFYMIVLMNCICFHTYSTIYIYIIFAFYILYANICPWFCFSCAFTYLISLTYFLCMSTLPKCMYVHHVPSCCP